MATGPATGTTNKGARWFAGRLPRRARPFPRRGAARGAAGAPAAALSDTVKTSPGGAPGGPGARVVATPAGSTPGGSV
ncbi:hypothetical protein GCM10017673_25390 [Streptosporangium violaceochromogenes]|nr:hypothetical protein GCM10017673_25390 [Streptosporangium violaceochromogenes]